MMDGPAVDRLVNLLGTETGATLQSILAASGDDGPAAKPEKRVGAAKVLQEWKLAWAEWDGCVSESCHEEGKYTYQDHHWEEPYLDLGRLAEDLDRTRALLEWECTESRKNCEPVSEAARRVAELTVQTRHLDLDDGAIVGFIRELSKEERRAVEADLKNHKSSEPWKSALRKSWSSWSNVFTVLGGRGKLTKAARS